MKPQKFSGSRSAERRPTIHHGSTKLRTLEVKNSQGKASFEYAPSMSTSSTIKEHTLLHKFRTSQAQFDEIVVLRGSHSSSLQDQHFQLLVSTHLIGQYSQTVVWMSNKAVGFAALTRVCRTERIHQHIQWKVEMLALTDTR